MLIHFVALAHGVALLAYRARSRLAITVTRCMGRLSLFYRETTRKHARPFCAGSGGVFQCQS